MNANHEKDRGAIVRSVLQGLILAGILGVVGMLWKQNEATAAQNVALGELRVQVSMLQSSLVGLPDLSSRVTKLETNQTELLRRQNADEQRWERLNNSRMKEWQR